MGFENCRKQNPQLLLCAGSVIYFNMLIAEHVQSPSKFHKRTKSMKKGHLQIFLEIECDLSASH